VADYLSADTLLPGYILQSSLELLMQGWRLVTCLADHLSADTLHAGLAPGYLPADVYKEGTCLIVYPYFTSLLTLHAGLATSHLPADVAGYLSADILFPGYTF
jgi:hypothetical protein